MKSSTAKTNTKENYLKALYHLEADHGEVTINELARTMRLKMPSVTSMIQRLSEENLLKYEKYKPVKLTAKGKKEAALIIRKHRLTEMFLVEVMYFGWEEVHQIAEQMEHLKSEIFFNKIDEMLGYPKTDPHGSPIPDRQGKMNDISGIPLSEAGEGKLFDLVALSYSGDDLLRFLNSKNIHLGTSIKVLKIEPFDQSMLVKIGMEELTLSKMVCRQLLVNERETDPAK